MTATKNIPRIISIFLVFITCLTLTVMPAKAATSGGQDTGTISVSTKANWWRVGSESITLKQSKCKYEYTKFSWGKWVTKTSSMYPIYRITVYNQTTGTSYNKTLSGSSIKLSLDRNCNYKITVAYSSNSTTWLSNGGRFSKWINSPSWWVSGSCKATYQ